MSTLVWNSYKEVGALWARYWRAYGGRPALLRSPYLHAAFLLTLLCLPLWTARLWWESILGILPNVLGFTLGGYAILISFGDEKFKALLTVVRSEALDTETKDRAPTAFLQVSASFNHFIVVQAAAMVVALLAKAGDVADRNFIRPALSDSPELLFVLRAAETFCSFFGYFLFLYSLLAAVAGCMFVFRLSYWFELFSLRRIRDEKHGEADVPTKTNVQS